MKDVCGWVKDEETKDRMKELLIIRSAADKNH